MKKYTKDYYVALKARKIPKENTLYLSIFVRKKLEKLINKKNE